MPDYAFRVEKHSIKTILSTYYRLYYNDLILKDQTVNPPLCRLSRDNGLFLHTEMTPDGLYSGLSNGERADNGDTEHSKPSDNVEDRHLPTLSPSSTSWVYQAPFERIIHKHYGHLILKALYSLSKESDDIGLREALENCLVFGRSFFASIDTYSAIQSVIIPGYFYIELGHFDRLAVEMNKTPYIPQTEALRKLMEFGVIPLHHGIFKQPGELTVYPGGQRMVSNINSSFCYALKAQMTDASVMQFINALSKRVVEFNEARALYLEQHPSRNPAPTEFSKVLNDKMNRLFQAFAGVNAKHATVDSDDDYDKSKSFHFLTRRMPEKVDDDMYSYAAHKNS